jgi:purine nucleosidase/pyrimidine-specific ribonucleoside hydrolase
VNKSKIILDTDAGVDDAMAIILALRSPELEVMAITTVSGNVHVDHCTKNVLRILSLLECERYPVVARGEDKPLKKKPLELPSIHGNDGLGDLGDDYYPKLNWALLSEMNAIDLISETISQNPNEITIIALGPLTNIARAIQTYPLSISKAKEIIFMGGAVNVPGNIPPGAAEFNIYIDPHAAETVLGFCVPVTMVPLDVTHEVKLMRQTVQKELGVCRGKIPRFIVDITHNYMDFYRHDQGHDGCYLHDPLAVGTVIDPSLMKMEQMKIYIETEGKVCSGMTLPFKYPSIMKKEPPNCRVCTAVAADNFLKLFLERVKP